MGCWAEARIKIARMTLTIKLDRNWSSFQLANSAPPLSVTGSAIAPSARMSLSSEGTEPPTLARIERARCERRGEGRNSWLNVLYLDVTPKGVLQPAWCDAGATRQGRRASSCRHLPKKN